LTVVYKVIILATTDWRLFATLYSNRRRFQTPPSSLWWV